MEPENTRH